VKITEFVREDLIIPDLVASDKSGVIAELAGRLSEREPKLPCNRLVEVLMHREQLASTAIGEGVAIPHGKLDKADQLLACVGRSPQGVDFQSMDGAPTHIFFVLIAPENSTGVHLKALARISRLFKSNDFRTRLMSAQGSQAIYRVIADEDAKY
jgi:PTS system nitrogen regulatory IIA component